MDPRTRNITSGGQHQYLYDHSTPYGRFNAWVNRLPWNWILIVCAVGFLVLLFYISIEPSIQLEDGPVAFALNSKDYANSSLLNNETEYVFEGDGIHAVKFPGFDTSLNTSAVETILLRNAHIDLPQFINQIYQSGLEDVASINFENVSVSGTLNNQLMSKVKLTFLS